MEKNLKMPISEVGESMANFLIPGCRSEPIRPEARKFATPTRPLLPAGTSAINKNKDGF